MAARDGDHLTSPGDRREDVGAMVEAAGRPRLLDFGESSVAQCGHDEMATLGDVVATVTGRHDDPGSAEHVVTFGLDEVAAVDDGARGVRRERGRRHPAAANPEDVQPE